MKKIKLFEQFTKSQDVNEAVAKNTKIYCIATPAPRSILAGELEDLFGTDYRHIVTEFEDDERYESVLVFNLTPRDIKRIQEEIADVLIWEYSIKKGKEISESLTEANRGKVHKAAKKGSFPAVIVVVKDGKVIHQEPVSSPEVAPATFNVMREKYPNALLHLEDKTGKRLFSESVITEATDINDPVLVRMRQAQKHANDMKKLDAMKKEAEKEARRNRPRWTQKKYDKWLETVASNGGAENAFDMAKNAEFEPGLIDWVRKQFRGDDPLQRIQWDIEGFAESVINEMDSEGIQSLADELNAEVYTARLKNGAKSASIKATTTTKTWDDGAPVLKYLARGKAKDMPFTLYQRPFTVLHDVAHGWFYFTDGRKWYGLHGDEGYSEPEDLPFDMEISESVNERYNDDDINMVYGFYGTVTDNSNEKNAKKLFDQGIKDLKKKYRLTEEEALEVLNSKMGRKAADQIYDGQAKTAVEGLETYYGKTLHRELAEIQKSMVFDSTITEAKAFTRAEVMDFLENHLKFVRTSEEFDGVEGGIWTTAENGETMGSSLIFDYYSTSSKYEFGVLNKFAKKLSKMGWYCEYYDPGTVMIWPI